MPRIHDIANLALFLASDDIVARCPVGAWLPAQHFGRPAHRICDPLHPDLSTPACWRRRRQPRAREDRYRHFELEPRPIRDMDPDMLALHQAITERNAKILYRGTGVESYNDPPAVGLR